MLPYSQEVLLHIQRALGQGGTVTRQTVTRGSCRHVLRLFKEKPQQALLDGVLEMVMGRVGLREKRSVLSSSKERWLRELVGTIGLCLRTSHCGICWYVPPSRISVMSDQFLMICCLNKTALH